MRVSPWSRRFVPFAVAATLIFTSAPGCFQQDNNAEFMRNAPAPPPEEHPNESVAQRRSRTHRPSSVEKRADAKAKARAKAKAPKAE